MDIADLRVIWFACQSASQRDWEDMSKGRKAYGFEVQLNAVLVGLFVVGGEVVGGGVVLVTKVLDEVLEALELDEVLEALELDEVLEALELVKTEWLLDLAHGFS